MLSAPAWVVASSRRKAAAEPISVDVRETLPEIFMPVPTTGPNEVAARALNGRRLGSVLANLEGRAAAAGCNDVRVVDLEPGTLEGLDVVNLGAIDELHRGL